MQLLVAFALLSCAQPYESAYDFSVVVRVVDEDRSPIGGARVEVGDRRLTTNRDGEVEIDELYGPSLVRVRAAGHLPDFLAVDRSDSSSSETESSSEAVELRLFARTGPDGSPRWALHAGGDSMFGRRYIAPPDGLALLPAHDYAGGAEAVTAELAPIYGLADLSTVNFESVVGDVPDSAAYPGKRFVLLSPPEALAGLTLLGVDLVTLGNNHVRDYGDVGVAATEAALEDAGLAYAGTGDGFGHQSNPAIVEPQPGVRVAVFSYTSVNGDVVNAAYPDAAEAVPAGCAGANSLESCFMYEDRVWGCEGESVTIPEAPRRPGPAWAAYAEAEELMSSVDRVTCWTSLSAVYPELQDWTARRGHAGAAEWDELTSPQAIEAAVADASIDLTIVQLHSGFQFQTAPSEKIKAAAKDAIDAGADLVIGHHPHVVQGVQWYRGKLIVYSLANFIFDQDFLVTFMSAFSRTVWDGHDLLEARMVPIELVGYRPMVATGPAALRSLLNVWEGSAAPAFSARGQDNAIRRYLGPDFGQYGAAAHLRRRHHQGVIVEAQPVIEDVVVEDAGADGLTRIGFPGLIHAQAGGAAVELGRELFGWGSLEDQLADEVAAPAGHWFLPEGGDFDPVLRLDDDAAEGLGWIDMFRAASFSGETFARPVARIPLPEHRFYRFDSGFVVPDDGPASYSIHLKGRLQGEGQPFLRLELFYFEDTDPTEDPETLAIGSPIDLAFDLEADDRWHDVAVELDSGLLSQDGLRANVVLVRVRFAPPDTGESSFGLDAFEFIEWRDAELMPDHFGDFGYVRGGPASLTLAGMAADDP